MKHLKATFLFLSAILFLSACTMVKHKSTANFQRVKYNPHLKMAQEKTESIQKATALKLEKEAIRESESAIEDERQIAHLIRRNGLNLESSKEISRAKPRTARLRSNSTVGLNKQADEPVKHTQESAINTEESILINALEPMAAASEEAVLDLIYIILIVLLVLIVIGLIIDLSGGLLGSLIAILLILLILHLLGVI